MRAFVYLCTLLTLAPVQALAAMPPTTLKGQLQTTPKTTVNFQAPLNQATQVSGTTSVIETGSDNALVNPRFAGGTTGWTISGGSSSAASNTLTWDSSAASQSVTSTGVVVTTGDEGKNQAYAASCRFKCAAGGCTHKLQLTDGTNTLSETTITSSTDFSRTTVTGIAPSSGSVYLKVLSVASNEPSLDVKNCYLGRAEGFNWAQVSQTKFLGTVKVTGCSSVWSTTSTSYTDVTQTGCSYAVTGSLSAPSSNYPGFKLSGGPGRYFVLYSGGIGQGTTTSNEGFFQLYDGTNSSEDEPFFANGASNSILGGNAAWGITESSPFSNIDFRIRMKVASGAQARMYGTTTDPGTFSVYYYPTSSEGVVRGDQVPASWSGYHDSTCSWSRTNTVMGDFTADASCALVERYNRNFGTVSTSGSVLPAITITPTRGGRYLVLAKATQRNSTVDTFVAQLWDGTNVLDEQEISGLGANARYSQPLFGIVNASSTSPVTLTVRGKSGSGTTTIDIGSGSYPLQWIIIALDQAMPQFLIPGSVFSSSTGAIRTESNRITCGSSGSTTSSSGTGNSWLSVANGAGAGQCSVTIAAGVCANEPTVTCTIVGGTSSSASGCWPFTTPTSTSISLWRSRAGAGENGDVELSIKCQH